METAYSSPHRLARMDPIWLLLGVVAAVALGSLWMLYHSNQDRFVTGFLAGVVVCALGGFAFVYWRRNELKT